MPPNHNRFEALEGSSGHPSWVEEAEKGDVVVEDRADTEDAALGEVGRGVDGAGPL